MIDDDVWDKYSNRVQTDFGSRQKGNVLNILIRAYVKELIDAKRLESQLKNI